jgi:hypothetical protein
MHPALQGSDHHHRRRRRLRRLLLFLQPVSRQGHLPGPGENAGRNINRANQIRPWLFLFPAIFALGLYLAYPVFETLRLSLTDRDAGGAFVGLANYNQMFSEPKFWEALTNNMLWLFVVPAFSTAFGLLAAQLTDRIAWGNIAKSLIFMPMAISFVGAAVIFKLIYDARPGGPGADRCAQRRLAGSSTAGSGRCCSSRSFRRS